jgi:hypothetical protein
MAKPESDPSAPLAQPLSAPRRGFTARRLLIATIGAATVNYAMGCGGDTLFTSVANLMAPPMLPPASGTGGVGGLNNPTPTGAAGVTASDADGGAKDEDAGARR